MHIYSRVLVWLLVLVKQRKCPISAWKDIEDRVKDLCKQLYSLKEETPFKEKARPRYAMACIRQAKESLKLPKRQSHFMEFLNW